jgi:outer membrane lipoprotein SlyB
MRVLTMIVAVMTLVAGFAAAQSKVFVYPTRGQNQRQQDIDTAECQRWASSQAHGGPPAPDYGNRAAGTISGAARGAALGAAVGGIAGGKKKAGKGAGAGAVLGGAAGHQGAVVREQQARAQAQNDWGRAFAACMQARGYSVR